jgi:Mlc titration factor MtfA (ptsG expression regulator)
MGMLGFRGRRRRRLMTQPLPAEWEAIVNRRVSYYHRLPADKKDDVRALVQVFLDEKPFEGCGGLEISDEIRVTVAGYACILLLGGQSDMYPKLRTVLVYPHAYLAPHSSHRPDGTVSEGLQPRIGESWSFGNIVLSWDDVLRDAGDPQTGRNVVFHEFAHQLDAESGEAEGAPILPAGARYADWARILRGEYEALIHAVEDGRPSLLDQYGATSPAEFFAVATECFFLKPREMESLHLKLYEQLKMYYRQDPAREYKHHPL